MPSCGRHVTIAPEATQIAAAAPLSLHGSDRGASGCGRISAVLDGIAAGCWRVMAVG